VAENHGLRKDWEKQDKEALDLHNGEEVCKLFYFLPGNRLTVMHVFLLYYRTVLENFSLIDSETGFMLPNFERTGIVC
jgi:hypothetical protein